MNKLKEELIEYYNSLTEKIDKNELAYMDEIEALMLTFLDENPEISPYLIKAKLQEIIADRFDPVIFKYSPFYSEMGMKPSRCWGSTGGKVKNAGAWMHNHFFYKFLEDKDVTGEIERRIRANIDTSGYHGIDMDHCYCNYTRLFELGLGKILAEAEAEISKCKSREELDFITAACSGLKAVLKIADKFADKAESLLEKETDPAVKKFLSMIANTAREVPRRPPNTFYEGLAALVFFRDIIGTVESIGISVVGHPDRLLIDLYRNDISSGRMTREEALDLIRRWMLPTDCKFDIQNNEWPETSTALILGGCDADGNPVYNELTRMFIECHHEMNLVNPKLNCRYGYYSPDEYLKLIAQKILDGHNVFTLINDDVIIPSHVKFGKKLEECRNYGAGGCQEVMIEGVENPSSPYYLNMVQILTYALNPSQDSIAIEQRYGADHRKISDATDFATFYREFVNYLNIFIDRGARLRIENNWQYWPEVNPCPFFSSVQYDCLKNHRDYSNLGGRYTVSGLSLIGLGTLVDSLYAIRKICFETKLVTLGAFSKVLANNWEGYDQIRSFAKGLPKLGHDVAEVDEMAADLCRQVAESSKKIITPWNNSFELSFFVYYTFVVTAEKTPATPDGRKYGELFSQGISPGRINPPEDITKVINSLAKIDFTDYPGNAILDLQLPLEGKLSADIMNSLIRTAGQAGIPTLQFNCVDVEALHEAQVHPENYRDLTVRISGLSARFVALEKSVQDEIINRHQFAVK